MRRIFVFVNSVIILIQRVVHGRIHFSKRYSGQILSMEDGKTFEIFRDLWVDAEQDNTQPGAVFLVRFKFSNLPLAVNKRLSMMPTPFLLALPGFREKIWTASPDGTFQGLYQWASRKHSEDYPNSFIFKLMTKRSAKGTLNFKTFGDAHLHEMMETWHK